MAQTCTTGDADALFDLVKRKVVHPKEAPAKAVARTEMKAMLERLEQQMQVVEKNAAN